MTELSLQKVTAVSEVYNILWEQHHRTEFQERTQTKYLLFCFTFNLPILC